MMEGPRHQHPHQEWQEPLEERLCAMMSQMRLTSSDISASAPTTKTSTLLNRFLFLWFSRSLSLFSLSFAIVRERTLEAHSARSDCHLRQRRRRCAVKRPLRFDARCALANDSQDSC